jgi:KDO2-lipid IV(A) lauroyltransferase
MSGAAIAALGYRAAWATAAHLPDRWGEPTIARIADRIVARRGPAVVQLARNLRRVLGADATPSALHAVTRAALRSYGRYWWETFRLHRYDQHDVAQQALAATAGVENVYAARDAGRGIILALPHSGNWDIAGLSMVEILGGITTVAERLKPESLYRRFVTYRERLGFEVLPLGENAGASAATAAVLRQRLEQGRMVCLLADRDMAGNGVPVTFFGEKTTMPAGPALLAARTGADLCPVHLAYTDGGWIQHVGAPLTLHGTRLADQVKSGTQQLADLFAAKIALFPADWHMLQPLWPADRPATPAPSAVSS